jgi:hypothetical protein
MYCSVPDSNHGGSSLRYITLLINKNVFNHQFILYSHSQLVTGARDPDMIATFVLFQRNEVITSVI